MKVLSVIGTRPEIIRLSRVLTLLDKHIELVIAHTGQNYDYELNQIFFEQLEVRKPDYFMEIETTSLGKTIGEIFSKTEEIILKEKPEAFLILGDTNSCLSAYIAKRYHIPIFHMEAGNRSFDLNVPEEINRKVIDHLADFNLVYTENARNHLINEGISQRRIYLTGSPMFEILEHYKNQINNSNILSKLNLVPRRYFVISIHREENVDDPNDLKKIIEILNAIANKFQLPLIVSTHPRTKKRIDEIDKRNLSPLIHFLKPFGFFEYISLQKNALCTISDSGTISEESAILNFPAISIRRSMERPEAQDHGTIILTGLDSEVIINSIEAVIAEFEKNSGYLSIPLEYKVKNTSYRVLKLILGNTRLSNQWDNVKNKL